MEIRIVEKIDDPFLQSEWERLEQEGNIFPQSTYHWCSTWWKYLGGKRKLHVVMALDESGKVHGIAPLCIEKDFGVPVLRSFPIHFGDFYSFITLNNATSQLASDCIFAYLATNRLWRWIRLDQVSEKSNLLRFLRKRNYREKKMTGCVIVNFVGKDWDSYLAVLKKKFRTEIRRRLRKVSAEFNPELTVIGRWEEYENKFNEMMAIYDNRWVNDNRPTKDIKELNCWRSAIKGQIEKGTMVYYQLLFDGIPVAYRLGFLHQGTFYAWHTSFNPDYRQYHPGIMIMALMIKDFMDNNIYRINFMAGEYSWKLDWSPDRTVEANYIYTSHPENIAGFLLNWYHHDFRDRLKLYYHRLMKNSLLRSVSRNVIRLRQKISCM